MTNNHTKLTINHTKHTDGDADGEFSEDSSSDSNTAWSSSTPIHGGQRLTPRSRQSSSGLGSFPTRFSNHSKQIRESNFGFFSSLKVMMRKNVGRVWLKRPVIVGAVLLVGLFFMFNWWMLTRIQDSGRINRSFKFRFLKANSTTLSIREELMMSGIGKRPQKTIYARLLAKASHALAERHYKIEPKDLWKEPYYVATAWKPCSEERNWEPSDGNNGYIIISANGGINQQRVAVCNAVAVARLLSATLVIPKFLYSSVWRDISDIYQEEHFINYLKPDIRIVKELPKELQSLDLEAIGSVVTDADVVKEAKPSFFLKNILPILRVNRVLHFVGFGNRLASDPIPFELQFVPKIQAAGSLLLQRMRKNATHSGPLDKYLVGSFAKTNRKGRSEESNYLALHLRFEIDMAAHSLCEFGGGEEERRELEAYRQIHFPALVELKKMKRFPSPAALRIEGLCPLMPEETGLMLAALGYSRGTRIFLAGAHIYGGKPRLAVLTTLFPNLVTKENLLTPTEIEPFINFSSQLAALDFIGCTASDAFAMTDSGSQLSSLVSGYRVYYGGGRMPTIRPNKRRLTDIFLKNNTIEWKVFENRVKKAVRQNKRVYLRPTGRSVYRYPRCHECMCDITKSAV